MKLPLVSRKKYEPIGQKEVEPWHFSDADPSGLCYHDKRIGWVKRLVFDTHDDYLKHLRGLKKNG